jgi:UDP-N-acetylglucosamine--N-acetylmuramyl-(pentapeptide) pyrophosphoryl-undecaprenol N-acetylglucosamine transferase
VKVLVAVGMTGGHIIPGIAVAEELRSQAPHCDVVFAGTTRGRAGDLVKRAGYRYIPVPVRGWAGFGALGRGLFVFFLAISLFSALCALLREKPCVVVGTGSFATLPFALCAVLLSLPLVLLEQNVVPGRATRFLSRFAAEVHVAYRASLDFLSEPRKGHVTGNPIRRIDPSVARDAIRAEFNLRPDARTVLIFGGSRGAHSINTAFAKAVKRLAGQSDMQFVVQTGEADAEFVREACTESGVKAFVTPFIHEMNNAYSCSDLAVCRAGATTIAELTAHGLPSILIPYPFSAGGHQEKNAALLESKGAAVVVANKDLTGDLLASRITDLLGDNTRLASMGEKSGMLGRKDAARMAAQSIVKLGEERCSGR